MKKLLSTFFIGLTIASSSLSALSVELNGSYDYFRGIPDGSWNGNSGLLGGINCGYNVLDSVNLQLGGSYGVYNWNGRGNIVFRNPKAVEQIGFITAGASTSLCDFNFGLVYDRIFTHHFGIYDLSPSIDQLRFQTGYNFCDSNEVGLWGTIDLSRSKKSALGVPTKFKTIGQLNLFYSHYFVNCANITVWAGLPYRNSLRFPHGKAGNFIAGFSFRAPLTERLSLVGYGSYMVARHSSGVRESRNYGANICIGITYSLYGCDPCETPYLPIANHSNFLIDTNQNQ